MASRYLLDTNIVIYIRERNPLPAYSRFSSEEPDEMAISTITYGELDFGVRRSANPAKARAVMTALLQVLRVLPLPPKAGEVYGALRASLSGAGQIIGGNDLWIAAHALAEGLILVTNNEREFKRIKGLKVENWAR
jgi:tRNA(fMet)-specific endonuclease VapC